MEDLSGPLTLGLMHLLLASAQACNEALHLSGWSGAGQPGRGRELAPGLLLRPAQVCKHVAGLGLHSGEAVLRPFPG